MTRRSLLSCCAAALVALAWTAPARADFVNWSYSWSPASSTVSATTGSGLILLSGQASVGVSGDTDVVAANLRTISTALRGAPDTFSSAGYGLTVTLKDEASGQSGSLTFTGAFDGTLSAKSAKIGNTFTGPLSQSLVLGANEYTVTMTSYLAPGSPSSFNEGGIGASVSVSSDLGVGQPNSVPEPSALLLAGLGCSAFLGWRVRRRRLAA